MKFNYLSYVFLCFSVPPCYLLEKLFCLLVSPPRILYYAELKLNRIILYLGDKRLLFIDREIGNLYYFINIKLN